MSCTKKLLLSVRSQYGKAPFFKDVYPLIERILLLAKKKITISDLAGLSVSECCKYLGMNITFLKSSEESIKTISFKRENRILEICKSCQATTYINPFGGQELYSKEHFLENNIKLEFIKVLPISYEHFNNPFVPNLSIIDVLMFNSITEVNELLKKYELI